MLKITPEPSEASLDRQLQQIAADPIEAVRSASCNLGFAAQANQLLIVILGCLSAAAKSIFHIHLVGDYGAGKSTVTRAAARIVGDTFVVSCGTIWTLTAAAAARMNDRLRGRCLMLDERTPNKEFEGLIRIAASGFSAIRTITLGGQAVDLLIEPFFSIVEAMLDDKQLNRQDRSRYFRIRMAADCISRDAISMLSRTGFTIEGIRRETQLKDFARAFQIFAAQLADVQIIVPFAGLISIDRPAQIRDRLIRQVLNATRTVTWLRQHQRTLINDEGLGSYVCSTVDDYKVIYDIVTAVGDDGADEELSDNAVNLFRMWSAWARKNGNGGVKRDGFGVITSGSLSPMQTYRALVELAKAGYSDGPRGRGMVGHWRLTELGLRSDTPNLFSLLPTPDAVAESLKNCNSPGEHDLAPVMAGISSFAEEGADGPL